MLAGCHARDAREHVGVTAQPAGLGDLGGGAFGFADEAISRGKGSADSGVCRFGGARLFELGDRVVGVRLQQMRCPNQKVPNAETGIARTEANGLLDHRDGLRE